MLVAYLMFSFIDTGSKWLAIAGLSALQLSFMRYIGHFCISLGLVGRGGFVLSRLACEKPLLVVVRGLLLMMSTVLNFFAIRYLPLSLTGTILFSAPIIVCALSWPLLRERVGIFRWFAIMLGFGGIIVAIRPFSESFHWAVFLSLTGAVGFALYSILTRRLSGVVSTNILQFYSGLVGTAVLLPFAVLEWKNPVGGFAWLTMLSLGFFGWAGHQMLTRAMNFAPANLLMPFGYSFILYLTIWSYLVFNDVPDFWTLTGAAIIIVAGLIIWFRERQIHQKRNQEGV
ncbi:MAG: DMT family transporter [Hyphomicrobiales bacterium]|nr:DMT family transporter [Hyphomicrobiales bacterium]MCP4997924.1 DMT family transporter [Hyphomicrobiales bacterium]